MQGTTRPLHLAHNAQGLTDGAGLLLVRQLWDRLQLGARIDRRTAVVDRRYRSSLFIESWIALLLYGGGVLDDVPRLAARGVAQLFGWRTVPDPTTFGRWLRRGGAGLTELLDELLWYLVRARWAVVGRPPSLLLILDSTVVQRYGLQQAGAERGYNPTKRGRPSHHPLLAFTDQGDCLGVRWRGGAAHTAAGAVAWLRTLVGRLRQLGIADLTVRLDKGFCSRAMVEQLQALDVAFVLKVPDQAWVRAHLGRYRQSEKDPTLWTACGDLYGARLCSVEQRLPLCAPPGPQEDLGLDPYVVPDGGTAHVLTTLPDVHALTAWRRYNDGAVVEQRIKECYQLGFGRTAIDDRAGNATLAALGALAYQVLHVLRTTALTGPWRRAQPATLRAWLFRLPGKCTTHARKAYVRLLRTEPLRPALLRALRVLLNLPPPRTRRLALA
ncbi:MAG: IS1380 family transposase [Gemmatimonadales bacterium]